MSKKLSALSTISKKIRMAKWKINRLEEKLKNIDYPKFLKLFNSEDPKYYFVCMSACRGVSDEEEPSQKMIDDINHRNNKASEDLMNQLIANGMHFMEVRGHYDEKDTEGNIYTVIERSFLVYSTGKKVLLEITSYLGKLYEQNSILFIDENKIARIIWLDENLEQPEWTKKSSKVNFDQDSLEKNFTVLGRANNPRRFQLEDLKEVKYNRNFILVSAYRSSPHYLNYTRFREPGYIEKFEKKFKEDYHKDLR